jgi:hypothetical protein
VHGNRQINDLTIIRRNPATSQVAANLDLGGINEVEIRPLFLTLQFQ